MSTSFVQSHETKIFVKGVNALVDGGLVKNRSEIVTALDWNKPTMSEVMNGVTNVPKHIFAKFRKVYPDVGDTGNEDYQAKYIALLEEQIDAKTAYIREYQEKLNSAVLELQKQAFLNRNYLKTLLLVQARVLAAVDKKKTEELYRSEISTLLGEALTGAS